MATLPFGLPFWWSLLPDAQLTDWGVAEHTFSFAVAVGEFKMQLNNRFNSSWAWAQRNVIQATRL